MNLKDALIKEGYFPVSIEDIELEDRVSTVITTTHYGVEGKLGLLEMVKKVIAEAEREGFETTKKFAIQMEQGQIEGAYNFLFVQHKDDTSEELRAKTIPYSEYCEKYFGIKQTEEAPSENQSQEN